MDWQRKRSVSSRTNSFSALSDHGSPVHHARGIRNKNSSEEQSPIGGNQGSRQSQRRVFGFIRPGSKLTTSKSVGRQYLSRTDSIDSNVTDSNLTDYEGSSRDENIQVLVRVRPLNQTEMSKGEFEGVQVISDKHIHLVQNQHVEPQRFTFDRVFGPNEDQEAIFQDTGMPLIENVLQGYNSSIFAYGQTGAGKTYTMTGGLQDYRRGIAPRVFEYLFKKIKDDHTEDLNQTIYNVKCSFLEIYNESITDLLNPQSVSLQIREEVKRGTYVDGLTEHAVLNEDDVLQLLKKGSDSRRVGETMMNRESSRSHAVFSCVVEKTKQSQDTGVQNTIFSRLHLVDLAGSERVKVSKAEGEHLKESCHINKSLSTLGRVIMELVEVQRHQVHRHIPYRDSRLTFLLQDSLGGNARTTIIANVSPSSTSFGETASTLHFASRAKYIRNRAVVNQELSGGTLQLQREIASLKAELQAARVMAEPLTKENAELQRRLQELESGKMVAQSEIKQLKLEAVEQEEHVKLAKESDNQLQMILMELLEAETDEQTEQLNESYREYGEEDPQRAYHYILKRIQQGKQNVCNLSRQKSEMQLDLDESKQHAQQLQSDIELLQNQLVELTDNVNGLQDWSKQIAEQNKETTIKLEEEKKSRGQLKTQLDEQKTINTKLDKQNKENNKTLKDQQLNMSKKDKEISELRQELDQLDECRQKDQHNNFTEVSQLQQQIDKMKTSLQEEKQQRENDQREAQQQITQLENEKEKINNDADQEKAQHSQQAKAQQDKLQQLEQEYQKLENDLKAETSSKLQEYKNSQETIKFLQSEISNHKAIAENEQEQRKTSSETYAQRITQLQQQISELEQQIEQQNSERLQESQQAASSQQVLQGQIDDLQNKLAKEQEQRNQDSKAFEQKTSEQDSNLSLKDKEIIELQEQLEQAKLQQEQEQQQAEQRRLEVVQEVNELQQENQILKQQSQEIQQDNDQQSATIDILSRKIRLESSKANRYLGVLQAVQDEIMRGQEQDGKCLAGLVRNKDDSADGSYQPKDGQISTENNQAVHS